MWRVEWHGYISGVLGGQSWSGHRTLLVACRAGMEPGSGLPGGLEGPHSISRETTFFLDCVLVGDTYWSSGVSSRGPSQALARTSDNLSLSSESKKHNGK